MFYSMPRHRLVLLAALVFALASSSATAQTYYCNCDGPGAHVDCEDEDNLGGPGTGTGTISNPFKLWETARTTFTTAAAGVEVLFCQGGHLQVDTPTSRWSNTSCISGATCVIGDYAPIAWDAQGQKPIIHQTGNNGRTFALSRALTLASEVAIDIVGTIPADTNNAGTAAVWIENDAGLIHKIPYDAPTQGVPPDDVDEFDGTETAFVVSPGANADFSGAGIASIGRTVYAWADGGDPILFSFDGNNDLDTPSGNYRIENIDFRGPLDWSVFNTEGGTGFFIFGNRDDIEFRNVRVSGFGNGFNVRYNDDGDHPPTCPPDPTQDCTDWDAVNIPVKQYLDRIDIIDSEIFNNSGAGYLGGSSDAVLTGNVFHDNGDESILEHNLYFSRGAHRSRVEGNDFFGSDHGVGTNCGGASIVVHGEQEDLIFRNNRIWENLDEVGGSCFGLSVNTGYTSAEFFHRTIIERNLFVGLGRNAIGMSAASDSIIQNNVIIHTQTSVTMTAIDIENNTTGAGDESSTRNTIRNNSILFLPGTDGVAINVGETGTGNKVVSNAIRYLGTSSSFACFGGSTTAAPYSIFANNICDKTAGDWMQNVGTSLASWQAVGSGMGAGSLEADPGFADVTGSLVTDFDLSALSAASLMIEAGHPSESSPTDYLGVARGATPDAGAHQFGIAAPKRSLSNGSIRGGRISMLPLDFLFNQLGVYGAGNYRGDSDSGARRDGKSEI